MAQQLRSFISAFNRGSEEVAALLREGNVGLFVGAGLGFGPGLYPLWDTLLAELMEACEVVSEEPLRPSQKAKLAKENNPLKYREIVYKHFAQWKPTVQRVVPLLAYLNVKQVVTTNYDNSLLDGFLPNGFEHVVLPHLHTAQLSDGTKHVFSIHGFIPPNYETQEELRVVLAEDDYKRYYGNNKILSIFLSDLFRNHNIIFLGVSFDDDYVVEVMRQVYSSDLAVDFKAAGVKPRRRFALMGLKVTEHSGKRVLDFDYIESTQEKLRTLGVEVIWYDSSDNHQELFELVQGWSSQRSTGQALQEPEPRVVR